MMASSTAQTPSHKWHDYAVAVFDGQHDTHIRTGEDYATITLADVFTMQPGSKSKGSSRAFIPSSYCDYDARSHERQRECGSFVALAGDIDKGNHSLEKVATIVRNIAGDCASLIYSSGHARPGDMRWRVVLPLDTPVAFDDWHDAQEAFFALMEEAGVQMDHALSRAGQPVYLPNVPARHDKSSTDLRSQGGETLYYETRSNEDAQGLSISAGPIALGIGAIRQKRADDARERERIRLEAMKRRANRAAEDSGNIIADFNSGNSIATMLELCGYEQSPRDAMDWRSPNQSGDTFATRIIEDKWVSLSASDVACGVGERCSSGCFGDAYDLYVHFKHGGDHKSAFRELHAERRAANPNVIYGTFNPPPREVGDPGWQEIPEWMDDDADSEHIPVTVNALSTVSKLPLVWYDQVEPILSGNWIIKKVIPADGFVTIIGHPGCGKSFLALDMGCHIASGTEWQERKTARGLVIYLAAEGQRGQMNRVHAWRMHHQQSDLAFAIIPVAVNLRDKQADIPSLIETIRQAVIDSGCDLSVLVVDTLNRTFGGGDENGSDMSEYVDNVGLIKAEFGCTAIVVHHIPKNADGSVTERGHGSLRGAVDTSLVVSYDQDAGTRTVKCTKMKDGEDGWSIDFKLKSIELGHDEDGEAVSSCVVVSVDGSEPVSTKTRGPNLSTTQRAVYNELGATLEAEGRPIPTDIPESEINRMMVSKVAARDDWRERWLAIHGGGMSPESASKAFRRAVSDLKNKGLIGSWHDHVWLIRK